MLDLGLASVKTIMILQFFFTATMRVKEKLSERRLHQKRRGDSVTIIESFILIAL